MTEVDPSEVKHWEEIIRVDWGLDPIMWDLCTRSFIYLYWERCMLPSLL